MKKKNLKPIVISALLAVGFGASTVGTSFALFTDKADTSIQVTAGIVDIHSKIELVSYQSTVEGEKVTTLTDEGYTNPLTGSSFTISGQEVTISKMVPGDKLTVKVTNTNKSNVKTKTRFVSSHNTVTGKKDLFPALALGMSAVNAADQTIANPSAWMDTDIAENTTTGDTISVVTVTIEFVDHNQGILAREDGIDNQYQDAACTINFSQQAVQANAALDPIDIINAYLMQESMKGYGNKTMYEAMLDVAALQYTATTLDGYVWSVAADQFVPATSVTTNKNEYFKICASAEDANGFSIYAGNSWATANVALEGLGFDAGTASGISSVSYEGASDARTNIIRTNSAQTDVTVNAPNDTIKHFGEAGNVDIKAILGNSYHENGTAKLIAVKKGHVKLEEKADVNGIYVYNNSTEQQKDTSFQDIKITVESGVELPRLSRSSVTIAENGTKVCTIVTDEAKDVYLFNEGIYEQIKTVDEGKPLTDSSVTWADDDSNSENTQTAAQQLANEWNGSVEPEWSNDDTTRKLENITNKEEALGVDSGATKEQIEEAINNKVEDSGITVEDAKDYSLFKGDGTQDSPYEIYNGNDWYNLLTKYQGYYMGSSTSGLYVELKGDIDMTGYDISSYESYPRNFHLDGNNYTMKNFETSIWGDDCTMYLANSFKDIKLYNCHSSNYSLFGETQNANTASVTFNNVDLDNCSAVGGAYQYYDGSGTATFINCDASNTNIVGGYMASGGFVGNISTGTISIDNCSFGGSVVSTQSACGGFVGQSANYDPNLITIKNSTVKEGTVIRNVAGGAVAAFNAHTGTQDYAQFNNTFYGTLQSAGTKYKQGTDAITADYEPICTAADFTLDSVNGTITYNGSATLGKVSVQVYVTDDYIYNGTYYGGYNWYLCDPIKATSVTNGTTISGIPVITDFYNVVSSAETPVGLQTTDTTYVDEIHNGIFYFDARTYSWGNYMLGGTYNSKNNTAINPTSLPVYITLTVFDETGALSGVVSGSLLKYNVDLTNHGN